MVRRNAATGGTAATRSSTLPAVLVLALLAGCTALPGVGDPSTRSSAAAGDATVTADPSVRGGEASPEDRLAAVVSRLDSPIGGERSLEVADAFADGLLLLRDGTRVELTDGRGPWGGWEPESNVSQLRLVHSLWVVHDLVETGRPPDLALALDWVTQWATENPRRAPAHHMAWHDETTARRTTALVRLHDAYRRSPDADPGAGIRTRLRRLIEEHVDLLLDDDFHATGTNHGMFQDRAILAATGYLEVVDGATRYTAGAWEAASTRLLDYYRRSMVGDVHREHAPAYHELIAASALRDGRFLEAFGHQGAQELADLHARMVTYATHVIQPDGTWPLVSDTFVEDRPAASLWGDHPDYRFAVTRGADGEPPAERAVAFQDAGYVIMRSGWTTDATGTYLHFTAAYHTDYHKHADDLSVWLYHDGPLLTELGPRGYDWSDPMVTCAYSADAHNIATVDGVELPRTDDRVGYTALTDVDLTGNPWTATGVNQRLPGVTAQRDLAYDHEHDVVTVTDRLTTADARTFRLRWHLDPSVAVTVDGTTLTLRRDGLPPVVGRIAADADLEIELLGPEPDRCAGLRFGQPEAIPTTTIEVRTTVPRREVRFTSRFELTSGS